VYALLVAALLALPERLLPPREHRVDVALVDTPDFVQQVAKPEVPPPPPPPPAPEVAPAPPPPPPKVAAPPKVEPKPPPPPVEQPKPAPKAPPAAAAPIVRPDQKIRRLDRPPPVKEFRAPREIPKDVPKEAEPSEDKGVAVYGEPGRGDAAGLEGGAARGGVAGGTVGGVIELPDGAEPPRLMAGATVPPYPAAARAERKSGTVVLKAIVYADGTIGDIRVLEGDEPFVSAALTAVRSWRYQPARLNGQPIAVYREIRIPFKLSG
jgi:periplasmic protein TonB